MIRNYLKIAWRVIVKDKLQSIIKLSGLTVGAVCFLLIGLFVLEQTSYDTAFAESGQIYRLQTFIEGNDSNPDFNSATASPPIAAAMKEEIPGIEKVTRIFKSEQLLSTSDRPAGFYEQDGYITDSGFLEIFNFPMLEGSAVANLTAADQIVLSGHLAKKLFGDQKALGKTVYLGSGAGRKTLTVTGVMDTESFKSHVKPAFLINLGSTEIGQFILTAQNWLEQNFVTQYLKLAKGVEPGLVEKQANSLLQSKAAENLKISGMKKSLHLQPLQKIYLGGNETGNSLSEVSSSGYLILLGVIALFILAMAAANYINLTTAQTLKRTAEIGVRKVVGASERSLSGQFLTESFLMVCISVILSVPLLYLVLPTFNQLAGAYLSIKSLADIRFIGVTAALIFVSGLLSGAYPAFYLSKMKPLGMFKKTASRSSLQYYLTNGLVVFQFAIVFLLLFSTILVNRQIDFLNSKDLGIEYKDKVIIPLKTEEAKRNYEVLKSRVSGLGNVKSVTGVEFIPSESILYDGGVYLHAEASNNPVMVKMNLATPGYYESLGVMLLNGRDVASTDENQVVVNQAFLKAFGLDISSAVGSKLFTKREGAAAESIEIVGVHEDFNQESLAEAIVPTMSYYSNTPQRLVISSISKDKTTLLEPVQAIWKEIVPDEPFEAAYLDSQLEALYQGEKETRDISSIFSFIAIALGGLGIWGLVSHAAATRFKEIGVRKALGATVGQVYLIISKKYMGMVALAALFGVPLAWYFSKEWLSNYQYALKDIHTPMLSAFLITVGIAVLSMSYSVVKAAKMNPVKSLKSE